MIREVFIDGKLVDIDDNNVQGYIIKSPVFRDISSIIANRTTTYYIKKTQRNLNIFGLSNQVDVYPQFPYQEHTFEEWRDGLLFIKGTCNLLKGNKDSFELSVTWGTESVLRLRDIKLRDLVASDTDKSIVWSDSTGFLPASSDNQKGFVIADFGKGAGSIQNTQPSVTVKFILDLIEQNTGITFDPPSRFDTIFNKKWIPLLDKNANSLTWNNGYYAQTTLISFANSSSDRYSYSKLTWTSGNTDIIEDYPTGQFSLIKAKAGSEVVIGGLFNFDSSGSTVDVTRYKLMIYAYNGGIIYAKQYFDLYREDGKTLVNGNLNLSFTVDSDMLIELRMSYADNGVPTLGMGGTIILTSPVPSFRIYVRYKEVRFGDIYPIVPNLPDLSVVEFLKGLLQMYGLFFYYRMNTDENTIQFISIDDIYDYKSNAYDYTHKLLDADGERFFNEQHSYGEYAQRNYFRYREDDTVVSSGDGFLVVENETLEETKDLIELPFAASDNISDENNNTYALIRLYDAEGNTNSIENRILSEGVYIIGENEYKLIVFDAELNLGGQNGLLNSHYSAYQSVIRKPFVVECYAKFDSYDLHTFNEVYPIYSDGVYYMPVEITIDISGKAIMKVIRMPYSKND